MVFTTHRAMCLCLWSFSKHQQWLLWKRCWRRFSTTGTTATIHQNSQHTIILEWNTQRNQIGWWSIIYNDGILTNCWIITNMKTNLYSFLTQWTEKSENHASSGLKNPEKWCIIHGGYNPQFQTWAYPLGLQVREHNGLLKMQSQIRPEFFFSFSV